MRQNLVQVTGKILDKAQEIVQVVPEISKKAPVSDAVKHGTTVEQFSHFDYVPGSKSNRQLSFSFISSSAPTVPSYELGAAQCLRDHIRSYILDESVFTGVGMGGLVAAAMVLDLDLKNVSKVVQEAFDKVDQSKVFGLIGSQSDAVYECLETLIPDNLSEEIAKKRLQLCLTKLPLLSKHTQSGFTSKDNLKRVLLASICSPPWSSSALPVDNDECYISGSWTNPMPIKDEFTVTVSSQSGAGTTICPSQNTLPKKKKTWSQLLGLKRYTPDDTSQDFENGYADTKSFLLKAYQTGDLSSLFFDRIPRA